MSGGDRLAGLGTGSGDPRPPAHAATVIVARDTPEGLSVLMARRNSETAFGGMWVFPGGKVDPGDYSAETAGDRHLASRNAAVREAKEETDIDLQAGDLVPYSHWTPPIEAPRRFLTWFFVAPAPPGVAGDVRIDEREITDHAWLNPVRAIEMHRKCEIELAPPTYLTLHDLSGFSTAAELLTHASSSEPVHYVTIMAKSEGKTVLLWDGDVAYHGGEIDGPGPRHRVEMSSDGWRLMVDRP